MLIECLISSHLFISPNIYFVEDLVSPIAINKEKRERIGYSPFRTVKYFLVHLFLSDGFFVN